MIERGAGSGGPTIEDEGRPAADGTRGAGRAADARAESGSPGRVGPDPRRQRAPGLLDEARLGALFDTLPEALAVLDPDGTILDVNPATAALVGCRREELLGRNAREFAWDPDSFPEEQARRAMAERGWFTASFVALRADGTPIPEETTLTTGVVGGRDVIFCRVRDMSGPNRINAEIASLSDLARIHESGSDVRTVAERAIATVRRALAADRAALGRFLAGGRLEWLAADGLGEIAEQIPGRPFAEDVPELAAALTGGRPRIVDRRVGEQGASSRHLPKVLDANAHAVIPMRAGEEVSGLLVVTWPADPPEAAGYPLLLETIGRLVGMAIANAQLRDGLVARQQALDESEARYRTLFYRAPEPLLFERADGAIVDANEAAERLFGRPRSDLIGRSSDEVSWVDPAERARRSAAVRATGQGTFRGTGVRADGTTFPEEVLVAVTSLRGLEHHLVQVRDLTDQQRLQTELLQAQKMEALGQLVSGVAHELNNPLSAIIAFSQLIRRDGRLPEELRRDADLLVQEADRTRRIVQNLLDFARQRPPERRPSSVRQLIDRTLQLHAYALGAGHVTVELDVPDDVPRIDADPNQIQQVLLNLTLNAIQALRSRGEAGRLMIGARAFEDAAGQPLVRLTVADDGPGVDASSEAHLFTPFFTTKPVGQGTGLGLSVSFGIVSSHGGRLWYEPRDEGGSRFCIELPAAAAPRPAAPLPGGGRRTRGARRWGGRWVVLAVDDEPSIRAFLGRALGAGGHEVLTAANGPEALEILRHRPVDVLLVDHRLPGLDGTETYRQATTIRPGLRRRTMLMSGDILNEGLRGFTEASGIRLVAKPFDIETLLGLIEEVMSAPESGDDRPTPGAGTDRSRALSSGPGGRRRRAGAGSAAERDAAGRSPDGGPP